LLPFLLVAQQPTAVMAPPLGLEKPVVTEEYVLMPGDYILVTVSGPTAYAYSGYVSPEGKFAIMVPTKEFPSTIPGQTESIFDFVDAVSIWGLKIKEAEKRLEETFRKYYKRPKVKITLVTLRQFIVYITGEVNNPGIAYASPVTRVSELIDSVEGFAPLGSRARVRVIRKDTIIIANIEKFENSGDLSANPIVKDGDVIYVPPMERKVFVRGAVFGRGEYKLLTAEMTGERQRISEGIYELLPGERISDIIRKAGGPTPWADLAATYILRKTSSGEVKINIDLKQALLGDTLFDPLLEDGDIVIVPVIAAEVYVEGEVTSPGAFDYQPGLTASDYIGMAGGPTDVANLKKASIYRKGERITYNSDLVIEPGDKIYVPRQMLKFWQDYLTIGQVLTTITLSWLTYIAVRR